jgi:hypothetical protein
MPQGAQGLRQARDWRAVTTAHLPSRDHQEDGLYGKSRRVHCIYKAGKMQDVTKDGGVLQTLDTLAVGISARCLSMWYRTK